ncbi:TBC1 domain family member 13-like protein, partial [Leptotrombidium deliense]
VAKTFIRDANDYDVIGRARSCKAQSVDVVRSTFGATEIRDNKCRSSEDDENLSEIINSNKEEFNWQVVARILFVYAKLNPGQSYVQGMNEIIGPIYYVFANDNKIEWNVHCEADTFWCFTSLMSEIRDMYNSQMDSDHSSGQYCCVYCYLMNVFAGV